MAIAMRKVLIGTLELVLKLIVFLIAFTATIMNELWTLLIGKIKKANMIDHPLDAVDCTSNES